jgi:hypothetical protein
LRFNKEEKFMMLLSRFCPKLTDEYLFPLMLSLSKHDSPYEIHPSTRLRVSGCSVNRPYFEQKLSRFGIRAGMVAVALLSLVAPTVISAEYPHFFIAEEPVNPRKSAMGGVGVALDGGGFCFYNPALIALTRSPFVGIEYGQQAGGDLSKSLIETAWMFPSWFTGASILVHSTDFQVGKETGVGEMSSNQIFDATIVGGYRRGSFASGHALTALSERIGDYTFNAVTYSTGATYQIIPGSLTAGASLFHYVRFDTTGTPWTKTPGEWYRSAKGLPRMVRGGVAWKDTMNNSAYTLAADLLYSEIDGRLTVPLGAEVWLLPSLAARIGGKLFNRRGDLLHMGCGIRWSSLAFDFDYGFDRPPVPTADLEPKWLFGLTYSLAAKSSAVSDHTSPPPVKKGPVVEEIAPVSSEKPAVIPQPVVSPPDPARLNAVEEGKATSSDTSAAIDALLPAPVPTVPGSVPNSPGEIPAPRDSLRPAVPSVELPDTMKTE